MNEESKHKFELNGEKLFLTMCKTNCRKPWDGVHTRHVQWKRRVSTLKPKTYYSPKRD